MPKALPNGVLIFNATPHDFTFSHPRWDEGVVAVSPDEVINAHSRNELVVVRDGIEFVTNRYDELLEGRQIIEEVRRRWPQAIIVGSLISAQAYAGDIASPIPWKSSRVHKTQKLYRPDRFVIYPKGYTNYGKQESR